MYDLELNKAIEAIKEQDAKSVLIQLPDGLKPDARQIQLKLETETDADILIWLGSCFGACDIPKFDADLLIQWGHTEWQN